MRTYVWVSKRLPGFSLTSKIVVVGAVLVHLPLLAVIALVAVRPELSAPAVVATALVATLVATAVMVLVLRGLLAPLQLAAVHLADYLTDRRLPAQVRLGEDDAGRLLHDVAVACARIEQQRVVLERLSLQDPLTGISNRRGGQANLNLIGSAPRALQQPVSVAVVDLDNLRQLNAQGGHARGDDGLRRVAVELQAVLRAQDWVARWGGDEFLVLAHCCGPDMVVLMDRARAALGTPGDQPETYAISVGVAELRPTESLDSCISRADQALYTAKNHGRDAVRAAS